MATPTPPDVDIAWKVWVGSCAAIVLATTAVIARLLARRISAASYWWDDATIVLALVLDTFSCSVSSYTAVTEKILITTETDRS